MSNTDGTHTVTHKDHWKRQALVAALQWLTNLNSYSIPCEENPDITFHECKSILEKDSFQREFTSCLDILVQISWRTLVYLWVLWLSDALVGISF